MARHPKEPPLPVDHAEAAAKDPAAFLARPSAFDVVRQSDNPLDPPAEVDEPVPPLPGGEHR